MSTTPDRQADAVQPPPPEGGDSPKHRSSPAPATKGAGGTRERRDSPWSDDPGPGAGKTSGVPMDYVPPGSADDAQGGEDDNRDVLRRPKGGTPNVPRP